VAPPSVKEGGISFRLAQLIWNKTEPSPATTALTGALCSLEGRHGLGTGNLIGGVAVIVKA